MANRNFTLPSFTLEKSVVTLSARVTFGADNIPTLDTNNSKGICNFAIDSLNFNANSVGSSATLSSVTSFAGLFPGMSVSGAFGSGTISSVSATAQTVTLASGTGVVSTNGSLVSANGGRFRVQFGTQAAQRLDTYVKLLGISASWDMSASSVSGTATVNASAPSASDVFVQQNNLSVRTIPQTSTSGSTDASLVLQFGNSQQGNGQNFQADTTQAGSGLRLLFTLGNSTAI